MSDAAASYTYTTAGPLEEADFAYTNATDSKAIKNSWDEDSNRVRLGVGTRNSQQGYVESYHRDFVYDPTAGIPTVLEESTLSATTYYIREPGGSLLARLHPTEGVRYYHFDELGSTRLLTDSSGNTTDKYAYDAYGALLAHDRLDGSVDQPYQYVGKLGYYTHWQEPDFGLLQLGVRFYDAEVGRFTQRAAKKMILGRNAYVNALPTTVSQPTDTVDGTRRMKSVYLPHETADARSAGSVGPPGATTCGLGRRLNIYENCMSKCLAHLVPSLIGTKKGRGMCATICEAFAFQGDGSCNWLAAKCAKLEDTPSYPICCATYAAVCLDPGL